jgi:tetrapyrrole methylase family protein/MazG family protein
MAEKKHAPQESILDTVPHRLPALMRAYRISERAARAGFDWDDIAGVMQKTQEEWDELQFELAARGPVDENQKRVALEFGDVLFTLVNVARFAKIHPETALTDSIKKFEKRFRYMEKVISDRGKNIASVSRNEWNILWQEAKEKAD